MADDQDRSELVNVSSGTHSPGYSRTNGINQLLLCCSTEVFHNGTGQVV